MPKPEPDPVGVRIDVHDETVFDVVLDDVVDARERERDAVVDVDVAGVAGVADDTDDAAVEGVDAGAKPSGMVDAWAWTRAGAGGVMDDSLLPSARFSFALDEAFALLADVGNSTFESLRVVAGIL